MNRALPLNPSTAKNGHRWPDDLERPRILESIESPTHQPQGYAKTTIQEIACEVGTTEGHIGYHFRTKWELASVLEEQARPTAQAIRAA